MAERSLLDQPKQLPQQLLPQRMGWMLARPTKVSLLNQSAVHQS